MNRSSVYWIAVVWIAFASPSADGADTVIAKVKVHNSASKAMRNVIVRGALPLPADYDKPIAALALADGGKALPTQVSVFATYPGSDAKHPVGRPEVVQLAARVGALPAGRFKEFDVVERDRPPPARTVMEIPRPLADWLNAKAPPVVIEATDAFGNRYRAEPLDQARLIETRQAGPLLIERVHQATLTPVGEADPDKPALKRFLRVRAYLTLCADEEAASLALMIHNGSINRPNGTVYYRHIRVGVAKPMAAAVWRKRFGPAADGTPASERDYTWIPCPPAQADGKVFVMPQGAAGVLRLTVHPPAGKARAAPLTDNAPRFVPVPKDDLFSWSNPATARYDAPKWPMPLRLDDGALTRLDKAVAGRLASPTLGWDLTYLRAKPAPTRRAMGHAMPAGVAYGGMTGGAGICYVFGARAALTGHNGAIHLHTLLADRNFDRQHVHLFYDDGRPYTYARHVNEANGAKTFDWPYTHRGWPEWRADDAACKVHADYVKAKDLLAPQAKALLRYMNHDDQHLSRVFDAVPAAYLACDPLNRDRLVTLGAQACWKKNLYPIRTMPKFGGWGSLFGLTRHVNAKPHAGVGMGRADGWVFHSLGWAMALSKDRQIRADCVVVARADVHVRRTAQMRAPNASDRVGAPPGGNVTLRAPFSKAFKGQCFFVTPWEEGAILADGARSVINILSSPADRDQAEAMKKVYARVGRWMASTGWNKAGNAPGFQVGLRKKGQKEWLKQPVYEGTSAFYMGTPFVWYYELTGEKVFLDRLKAMAGKQSLAAASRKNLGNWSYVLYLAQGGRVPVPKPQP